jgi:transcriptional regulator with XRE-family HTH domain
MSEIREMLRKNLKEYLSKSKYNQKQFAEEIGVSSVAVSHWIKGDNSPDIETIAKICDLLHIRFSDLITYPSTEIDAKRAKLLENYQKLNDVGKAKLFEHSCDMVDSGNYSEPIGIKKDA